MTIITTPITFTASDSATNYFYIVRAYGGGETAESDSVGIVPFRINSGKVAFHICCVGY